MVAPQPQTDFAVYRLGGHAVWTGTTLYEMRTPVSDLLFTYPPVAAVAFTPFAVLPLGLAEVVWSGLTVLALVGLLRAVRTSVVPSAAAVRALSSPWALPLLLVAALATEPVRNTLVLGQVNILLVLAIWLDVQPRPRRLPAGVLTGVAAAIKLTPLIFVPYLWLTGRRKAALWAVGAFAAVHAAAFVLAPAPSRVYWGGVFADSSRIGPITYVGNQSLYGALARIWGDTVWAGHFYLLASAGVAVAGLVVAGRLHRSGAPVAGLLAVAVTGLLVSPISWGHHWVWVVPALLWLAADCEAPAWGTKAALAGYVLFVVSPIWWIIPHIQNWQHHHGVSLVTTNSYTIAGLLFLIALGRHSTKSRRSRRGEPRLSPVRRRRERARIGEADPSLTGMAGLAAVTELVERLGVVEAFDDGSGRTAGAGAEWAAAGRDGHRAAGRAGDAVGVGPAAPRRRRRGVGGGAVRAVADRGPAGGPVRSGAHRRDRGRGRGAGRPLAGPAAGQRRSELVRDRPTMDLDSSDVEVYGRGKRASPTPTKVRRAGRPLLASWARTGLILAAELLAGDQDVRPRCAACWRRALANLPAALSAAPLVRADSGFFTAAISPRRGRGRRGLRDRRPA